MTADRPALTVAEAAELLGIATSTAYDLIADGTFPVPVFTVGKRMRISRRLLLAYIDQDAVA